MLYFREKERETLAPTSLTVGDRITWDKKGKTVSLHREGGVLLWPDKTEKLTILPSMSGVFRYITLALVTGAVEHLSVEADSHDDDTVTVKIVQANA